MIESYWITASSGARVRCSPSFVHQRGVEQQFFHGFRRVFGARCSLAFQNESDVLRSVRV